MTKKQSEGEVLSGILSMLSKVLDLKRDEIRENSDLREELGIDSVTFLEIVFTLEERFGLKVKVEDVVNFKKVEDIRAFISSRLSTGD